MAKVGLKYLVASTLTEGVTDSYGLGFKIAKAIKADVKINVNDVKLYADDAIAESDKSFKDGTISLDGDEISQTVSSTLLGHLVNASGELVGTNKDASPYFGVGFYARKIVNGVNKYRALFFQKVQFGEPSDTFDTKGESLAFGSTTIEGTIFANSVGQWKCEKTFNTEEEAKAWIDGKAGIKVMNAAPVASVAGGTYADTQSVTLTSATDGANIYYTTNGTTPSATNGTKYSSAISVATSCAVRAIAVKSGNTDSPVVTYEYIIGA